MSLIVLEIELTEKIIFIELGLFLDGYLQGFSFCPPKTYKPNKQTTCDTSHLHGIIAWNSGKLDYDRLFAVFYDTKLLNAGIAKGFEKCRLLTRLLGQNVENLDDYTCPKLKILLEKEKRTVRGCALVTLCDTRQGFTVPRRKQRCMENGLCNIQLCET